MTVRDFYLNQSGERWWDAVIDGAVSSARELHNTYLYDAQSRSYLLENVKHLELARLHLDETIRKLKIAPVVDRVNREARQEVEA